METAAEVWRRDNPKRERRPKGFEERIQLKLFGVEAGSVGLPIFYREQSRPPFPVPGMEDPGDVVAKLPRAAAIVVETVSALGHRVAIPVEFPTPMLPKLAELIHTLAEDESVVLTLPSGHSAVLDGVVVDQIRSTLPDRWSDSVDVIGEVTAAKPYDAGALSVWDLAKKIREETSGWDLLPTVAAENLDHYLYGAPRKARGAPS